MPSAKYWPQVPMCLWNLGWGGWGGYIKYPSEMHLKTQISYEISFAHVLFLSRSYYTEHDSINAGLCARFQNDSTARMDLLGEWDLWDFTRCKYAFLGNWKEGRPFSAFVYEIYWPRSIIDCHEWKVLLCCRHQKKTINTFAHATAARL